MMTVCLLVLALAVVSAADDEFRPDVVFADFEGDDYGAWQTSGTAFGTGPAKGTLPGQMPMSGFLGRGLVNSFLGGDRPIGKLASPEFKIERSFIGFLIGGGGYPRQTCINLVIDASLEPSNDAEIHLEIRGVPVQYLATKRELVVNGHRVAVPLDDRKIDLRIVVDRTSFEVFVASGREYIPMPVIPAANNHSLSVATVRGQVKLWQLDVHELRSIWSHQ